MHFTTEAVPAEVRTFVNRVISITGWEPWKRRLEWLDKQVRANPTMPFLFNERYGLEIAFAKTRRYYKKTGRYPWPPENDEQQRFFSMMAMIARCHHRLNPTGKKRLKGMILDALKSDHGLLPLAFEMKIAGQLMTLGFDVTFHDMEEGGGFDYLAEKGGVALEVECKYISGDIGQKIHLKRVHQLSTVLLPKLIEFLEQKDGGHLVRISIPDRLDGDRKKHQEIVNLVSRAFSAPVPNATDNGYQISISEFALADSPFAQLKNQNIQADQLHGFLSEEFGINNKNVLIHFAPNTGVVLATVESRKENTVLKGIHEQLKRAARDQLTEDRPGFLCCELGALDADQLYELGNEENGLQYMASDLLERRPHIHTVAFTTRGPVHIRELESDTRMHTSIRETGPAYVFVNPAHPLCDDPRYTVFG